jgi:hypothetical protein
MSLKILQHKMNSSVLAVNYVKGRILFHEDFDMFILNNINMLEFFRIICWKKVLNK